MSELTLTVVRLGLLVLLWVFVFSIVGVLRGDLYGTRVLSRGKAPVKPKARPNRQPTAPAEASSRASRAAARKIPATLAVTEGPLAGTTLNLKDSGVLIGRNPECTLVLDDDFASGRHARVYRDGDGWYVEDLGSTNGTFLGANRLSTPTPVAVGTTLRIGKTVLELRK
ncbi:FHA domain-containing protein FhaB/FipA [Oryzihumus sp.]|jgi:pSer/pThr/pTyr-binding forkhead associated (FHA) protein|uniref:FHA domain-containing protein FhaB/FipA n=1 Tax=Oryzihumus sp. TaxID=1968903 RepID=UPI002ED81225